MKNSLAGMNDKGISMVPRKRYGRRYFSLRCRSIDGDVWSRLPLQFSVDVAHATSAEQAINNCPGCGKSLAELIDANVRDFENLLVLVED